MRSCAKKVKFFGLRVQGFYFVLQKGDRKIMHAATILEVIRPDRSDVVSTVVTLESTRIERLGVCRERAEFLKPFVGQAVSKARFDNLFMERL